MTHKGTLFLDVPSVGGPSPEIVVETEPKTPDMFYHHSLFTQGGRGWPWVCASAAEGITSIRLSGIKPGSFTVRLYFIEPHQTTKGARSIRCDAARQDRLERSRRLRRSWRNNEVRSERVLERDTVEHV